MPTSHIWIGGAPAIAQVDTITIPTNVESGQIFNATIGNKTLSYTYPSGPVLADVTNAIVALWNASLIPEFAEITAAAVLTGGVATGVITLTAKTAGKPFVVTSQIGSGSNEKQVVTISGSASGGTFTLTFDGQTTSTIAYNATAATVVTELKALSNIGANDVTVTGDAGGPYTVEFIGDLAGTDVADLTADSTQLVGTNEEQLITLGTATGGTFTLTFNSITTAAIAYNASAATVESELEAIASIGAGNVSVSGSAGGPYTVEFQGDLRSTDVSLISFDGSNLTGVLAASIAETTPGGGGYNEKYQVRIMTGGQVDGAFRVNGNASVTAGTFTISLAIGGVTLFTTGAIAWNATVAVIQDALDTTDGLGVGDQYALGCYVSESASSGASLLSDGDSIYFWLTPEIALNVGPERDMVVTVNSDSLTGGAYNGFDTATPTFTSPNGDLASFYITVDGESTDDLSVSATNATVQAALEALTSVGVGNVTVTGDLTNHSFPDRRIEFIGNLANQATGLVVTIGTNSVGVSATLVDHKLFNGSSGTSEVQTLTMSGSPSAGTFALKYAGETTAMLNYNATASQVQSALRALSTIGSAGVTCTGGALPGTGIVITFGSSLSGENLDPIEPVAGVVAEQTKGGDQPNVVITVTQTPVGLVATTVCEGSNWWSIAANWNTNTVPVTGDTVYLSESDVSILYGLDQSAVTLAALHIEQTFTGLLGLSRNNTDGAISYFENRDQYLKIGATALFIGDKEGDGSERIKIDLGSVQSTVLITDSGEGEDENVPAILLLGTHASNVIDINRGELGVAYYPTEVSTIATLRQAFFDDAASDTTVFLGTGVTLTDVIKTGGELDLNSGTTTFQQTAGETTIHAGAHAQLDVLDGTLNYNSLGTASIINVGGEAVLNFNQDRRPKTVTIINKLSEESEINDDNGSVSSLVIDMENIGDLSQLSIGTNFKLTKGSTT